MTGPPDLSCWDPALPEGTWTGPGGPAELVRISHQVHPRNVFVARFNKGNQIYPVSAKDDEGGHAVEDRLFDPHLGDGGFGDADEEPCDAVRADDRPAGCGDLPATIGEKHGAGSQDIHEFLHVAAEEGHEEPISDGSLPSCVHRKARLPGSHVRLSPARYLTDGGQ